MQDFRRLHVWRRAHALCLAVREAEREFPRRGYTELKSQIRRSAESIPNNIVEGCAAASRTDFARFLDISIKSTSELDYQLELARDYGILPHRRWKYLAREVVEIRKMLSALRRAVLDAAEGEPPRRKREEEQKSPRRRRTKKPEATGTNEPEATEPKRPEATGTDD